MKVFSQLEKAQLENTTADTGSHPKGMITYRTDLNLPKVSNGTIYKTLVDEDTIQTLSNKLLASPEVTGSMLLNQIATPSAPASGKHKIYPKSDGKLYTLDPAGNEALLGSGAGGTKNYITDGDAEAGNVGVIYRTVQSPVTRPNSSYIITSSDLTLTQTTTSPLSGSKSWLLTKNTAINTSGEAAGFNFTIDAKDKAKVLNISFDYLVNSGVFNAGTSTTDSDIVVGIIDITNGTYIEPSSIKLLSNSTTIADKFQASFQTPYNSTSFRLVLHVAGTGTNVWSLKVDNISVSPSNYTFGTPITDWQAFTPTGTWTTNVTYTGRYRRVGDTLHAQVFIVMSGAPSPVTNLYLNLPNGLTIDTSKFLPATSGVGTTTNVFGTGKTFNGGSNVTNLLLNWAGTNLIGVGYENTAAGQAANVTPSAPFAYVSTSTISVEYMVPIQGWSSSVQMSDQADTRVVAAYISAGTVANGTTFSFGPATIDTHGGWNGTTTYTCKVPGIYKFSAQMQFTVTASAGQYYNMQLSKTGVVYQVQTKRAPGATVSDSFTFHPVLVQLNVGDTLTLGQQVGGTNYSSITAAGDASWISIERISGPQSIAATESVSASYEMSTGPTISSGVSSLLLFPTKAYDSHGSFNTANGQFVAPISGKYRIAASVKFINTTAWTLNELAELDVIYANGTKYRALDMVYDQNTTATAGSRMLKGSTTIHMNAGEYLTINVFQQCGGPLALTASASENYFSIERVGN